MRHRLLTAENRKWWTLAAVGFGLFMIRAWAAVDGRLWILTAADAGPGYQLLALDPRSGRATARVPLPGAGARALVSVDDALWVTLQNGRVAIVG